MSKNKNLITDTTAILYLNILLQLLLFVLPLLLYYSTLITANKTITFYNANFFSLTTVSTLGKYWTRVERLSFY